MLNSYLANVFLVTKRLVENPFDCYDIPWICFESTSLVLAHSLFLLSKQIQMLLTVSRSFQILNVINKMPIALHHYLQMMAVILGQGNCICSIDLIKFELNFDTQLVLRSLNFTFFVFIESVLHNLSGVYGLVCKVQVWFIHTRNFNHKFITHVKHSNPIVTKKKCSRS